MRSFALLTRDFLKERLNHWHTFKPRTTITSKHDAPHAPGFFVRGPTTQCIDLYAQLRTIEASEFMPSCQVRSKGTRSSTVSLFATRTKILYPYAHIAQTQTFAPHLLLRTPHTLGDSITLGSAMSSHPPADTTSHITNFVLANKSRSVESLTHASKNS